MHTRVGPFIRRICLGVESHLNEITTDIGLFLDGPSRTSGGGDDDNDNDDLMPSSADKVFVRRFLRVQNIFILRVHSGRSVRLPCGRQSSEDFYAHAVVSFRRNVRRDNNRTLKQKQSIEAML